ncbi:MAG: hypothetical protein SGI87_05660 [Flavobacteriales bacterium]|nr:hypothetical protein [Flavobacteriales bacterium]
MHKLILTITLISYVLLAEGQSGWLRNKGELWSQIGYQNWTSERYFNLEAMENKTNAFSTSELSAYAEYGFSSKITGLFYLPISKTAEYSNTERVRGLGDLRIELKFKPFRNVAPFAIQIGAEIPTGKSNAIAYNDNHQFGYVNLPTGDGEWNFWTHFIASKSISKSLFGTAYAAYNLRTSYAEIKFNDQAKAGLEIGYSPYSNAWIIGKYSALMNIEQNEGVADFVRQSGTTYSQFSLMFLTSIYRNFGMNIQLNGFTDIPIRRQNVYSSNYLSFGLVYEIKQKQE